MDTISDWRWLDAFRKGDDHAFSKQLEEETDRSLRRDPDRWSTKHVDETPHHVPKQHGGGDSYTGDSPRDRRSHKGHANQWGQAQYDDARRDYEAQQRGERGMWQEQDDRRREEKRSFRDVARDLRDARRDPDRDARRQERKEALREARREHAREIREQARQARDDYRQGRPPPGYRGW